jgi:hypothetical protein
LSFRREGYGSGLDGEFTNVGFDLKKADLETVQAEHKWDRKKAWTKDFGVALPI